MRRTSDLSACALALIGAVAAPAEAQARHVRDVAVSYSVLYDADISVSFQPASSIMPVGWVFAAAQSVSDAVAVLGEIGGNYKSAAGIALSMHTFQGGVRVRSPGTRHGRHSRKC